MSAWIKDALAGAALVIFIGSAFALAYVVSPAIEAFDAFVFGG
jgi:hypothetical protein